MLNFLGIGAQKSGTTWLYRMLSQHPDIAFPLQKEAHFWNHPYSPAEQEAYLSAFTHPSKTEGEITPAYAFLPLATIEHIQSIIPDLKLIYLIRNPIERAWSSALMALGRAEMEFEEASDQWFIDHFRSKGSLSRGNYEQSIKNWNKVFGKKQLLLLRHEELAEKPDQLLNTCCQFLDIEEFSSGQIKQMNVNQPVFAGAGHKISPHLENELIKLYSDKIESLSQFLEEDFGHWVSRPGCRNNT